jgi:hypothetical protein
MPTEGLRVSQPPLNLLLIIRKGHTHIQANNFARPKKEAHSSQSIMVAVATSSEHNLE